MFERSEFLSSRKMSAEWRVPEGQGAGRPFSAYSLWANKESKSSAGAKPQVLNAFRTRSNDSELRII